MTLRDKYELLDRFGELPADNFKSFKKRVKMIGEIDESYSGGVWDLASDIVYSEIHCGDVDVLIDLLYNLIKY